MILETLFSSALGGVFRLVPEVLKWMDRKDDRKHELAMFDKQLKADELRATQALAQTQAENEGAIGLAEIQALVAATQAQATVTGIKWVDAINSLMRPLITFWWVIVLYTLAIVCGYIALINSGVSSLDAVLQLFGTEEKMMVSSIVSFWFVDRSLRKKS